MRIRPKAGVLGLLLLCAIGAGITSAHAAQSPPSNTRPPAIIGTAQQGQTLTVDPGSWSGATPIAFAYQWLRCDLHGARCGLAHYATAHAYLVTPADVGYTLRADVTASNSRGAEQVLSGPTSVVAPASGVGPPTSKSDCKHGGWQRFTNPRFRNQGQCVSYVVHQQHRGGGKGSDHQDDD